MAAIVRPIQRQVVTQASSPVAVRPGQTAVGELGQGLADVGTMFDEWQDGIDTAAATNADAQMSDRIRDMLYADGDGFMYSLGGDTMNRRGDVTSALDELQRDVTADLNPAARMKANSSINARYQRALQTIDQHTAGQRTSYMNDAADARITTSINDAVADPTQAMQSISINRTEILDMAARNGWSQERTDLALKESRTGVYSGIIEQISNADPIAALNYLRDHQDEMTGSEVERLNSVLMPAAKAYEGRQLGYLAANPSEGSLSYNYSTTIDLQMGPARPDAPDRPVLDVIGRSVEDVLGAGARVVVTSGQEGDQPQHGSNRHMTGDAADIAIYRPDGTRVKSTDPDMAAIAAASAANGAKGIGFGAEYMGGEHMHIDLVEPGEGQSNTWASGGVMNRGDLIRIMDDFEGPQEVEPTGYASLLEIDDPVVRASAIAEYNLLVSVQTKERETLRQETQDMAEQFIEGGGSPDDLPIADRNILGVSAMNSLRSYASNIGQVKTDYPFYIELMELMATDPDRFMQQDPATWRDKLDEAHYNQMIGNRTNLISGKAAPGNTAITEVRTAASSALKAAGLWADTDENNKARAQFETGALDWASQFIADNGVKPSPTELNDHINKMLVPIVLNYSGWGKEELKAFQIDYSGQTLKADDDLTMEMIQQGRLKVSGEKVSEEIMTEFVQSFTDRYGVAPTVEQFVDGIISSGIYK